MSKNATRPVLSAEVVFHDSRWHLRWTEDDGTGSTKREIRQRGLDCRGRLNGAFARREAAQFLGCSEKSIGLESQERSGP